MPKKVKPNLRIALSGASGRMGTEIQAMAGQQDVSVVSGLKQTADWSELSAKSVDVVVDFSSPQGLNQALAWCLKHSKPLVSGTTGLSAPDQANLIRSAKKIPVLYSANMSLGIAILTRLLACLRPLQDWDFQIQEAHHKAKKDSPSGTAQLLQQKLMEVLGRDLPPPLSTRGGDTPGIHQVWAMGHDEALILQHTAFKRSIFALGALHAARWLFDKKEPGLYDLTDLYN